MREEGNQLDIWFIDRVQLYVLDIDSIFYKSEVSGADALYFEATKFEMYVVNYWASLF